MRPETCTASRWLIHFPAAGLLPASIGRLLRFARVRPGRIVHVDGRAGRKQFRLDARIPVATLCVSSTGACDVPVPEPGTLATRLGLAGLGLSLSRRRRAN
jgi:MYXO-CTERM domain-containing protein